MSKSEMIKWLQNLKEDIGQTQHQDLWHYEEMLDKVISTIEVDEDCISRKWLEENKVVVIHTNDEWGEMEIEECVYWEDIENAPSVAPNGTNVECYARNCEKNKNGKCEETDIILEFGCGD